MRKIKVHKSQQEKRITNTKNFFNYSVESFKTASLNVTQQSENNLNQNNLCENKDSDSISNKEEANSIRQTRLLLKKYEDQENAQIEKISLKFKEITEIMSLFNQNLEQQGEVTMQSIKYFVIESKNLILNIKLTNLLKLSFF